MKLFLPLITALVSTAALTACGGSVEIDAAKALAELDRQRTELVADLKAQQERATTDLDRIVDGAQGETSADLKRVSAAIEDLVSKIAQIERDIRCERDALKAQLDGKDRPNCL